MPADAGLGALPHLDLDGGAGVQVFLLHAEPPGGHLHDGVGAVGVEVPVQAALAGVVADTQLLRGAGKGGVGVVADGAVAHGGEQNGHRQLQLRRQVGTQCAVRAPPDGRRLLAQKDPRLHGLPQGIDGRIRHLRGVDQQPVPVHRQGLGVAHGAEQHAAGGRLLVDLLHGGAAPVGILPQAVFVFYDLQCVGGTEGHAALAVDALALVADHDLPVGVVGVYAVGALRLADTAAGAARIVSHHVKFRYDVIQSHQ